MVSDCGGTSVSVFEVAESGWLSLGNCAGGDAGEGSEGSSFWAEPEGKGFSFGAINFVKKSRSAANSEYLEAFFWKRIHRLLASCLLGERGFLGLGRFFSPYFLAISIISASVMDVASVVSSASFKINARLPREHRPKMVRTEVASGIGVSGISVFSRKNTLAALIWR